MQPPSCGAWVAPEQDGAADVRVHVDGREQPAEADQVVEIVDVVRVPVVLPAGPEEGVLDADLLVFLPGPAQFLVDIAGRDQRTIGVVHLVPRQRHGAGHPLYFGVGILQYLGHLLFLTSFGASTVHSAGCAPLPGRSGWGAAGANAAGLPRSRPLPHLVANHRGSRCGYCAMSRPWTVSAQMTNTSRAMISMLHSG